MTDRPKTPEPRRKGFPATYQPEAFTGPIPCRQLFDPALRHFPNAFRAADPAFDDPIAACRWLTSRRYAIDHLLWAVSSLRFPGDLVLRGSLLLKAWLGDAAREPGDMDWIVTPDTIQMTDNLGRQIIAALIDVCARCPGPPDYVQIDAAHAAVEEIWTYERAPGKRVVFPWRSPDGLGGVVQLDFVFGESLWDKPVLTAIPALAGGHTAVLAATMQQSLAWKIQWLESDCYPQGKDLYDAVLLAERVRLPFALLDHAVRAARPHHPLDAIQADFPSKWAVDWKEFQREYPTIPGNAADWTARLIRALAPTFSDR